MTDIDRAAEQASDKLEQVAEDTATELDRLATQVAEKAATELELVAAEAEAVRVAAEAKRQKQERDRRIAEGGTQIVLNEDEQEETGRVEAEGGRVEAETRRESVSHGRREAENQRVEAETRRVQRDKRLLPRISLLVALPLALISLVPSAVGLVLLQREIDQTSRDRDDNIASFARSDLSLCKGLENLKALRRAEAIAAYGNLDRTLAILKLERSREIEVAARDTRDTALQRFAARAGGCQTLPSNEAKEQSQAQTPSNKEDSMAVEINTDRRGVEVKWDASLVQGDSVTIKCTNQEDPDNPSTKDTKNDGFATVTFPAGYSGSADVTVTGSDGGTDSGTISV